MGEGKYAAARKLTQKDGKTPISKDYAQSPCMGDWDGDGDWDMAMGVIMGPVKLYLNNGDMTFTDAGSFKANGKEISVGDGGPCLTDWDGDGKLDLLLGDDSGNVQYYQGQGGGSLDLLVDKENGMVLPRRQQTDAWKSRQADPGSPIPFKPKHPGARTKPFAADWNGDGKLDLLVGDYLSIEAQAKPLTAAQRKELVALEKRQATLMPKMNQKGQKLQKAALKKAGLKDLGQMDQETMKKFSAAYTELIKADKEYMALTKEYSELYGKIAKLKPQSESTGVVWVYLRK